MFSAKEKLKVMTYAQSAGNVKETCEIFGISRTLYYKWKRQYETEGPLGLEEKPKKKPIMPNQVSAITEKAILEQVVRTPKDGPRQLCYSLNLAGYKVGETGVYRVLKRHQLTRRDERISFSKNRAIERSSLRQLSRLDLSLKQEKHRIPGYMVMETLRSLSVGFLKSPIYYYAIYDVHSHWGLVKLYPHKNSIHMADFYATRLHPLIKTFKLPIQNILSEQLPEFKDQWVTRWQTSDVIGFEHQKSHFWELPSHKKELIKPLESFTEQLLGKAVTAAQAALMKEPLGTKHAFELLERCLEHEVRKYNFKTPIGGQTPSEVVIAYVKENGVDPDSLPLWVYLRMV